MYTEIREFVNFLARYFHLRIPRLKIGMFCEHLANYCLLRFQPYWNINQPKQYEELRIIHVSRPYCDDVITSAANAVGVLSEELLACLPAERLILYINPGEVFYCSSDYSPPVPIWIGSVNEDLNYNEHKTSHSAVPPPPLPSSILPVQPSIQPLNSLLVAPPRLGGNHYSISSSSSSNVLASKLGISLSTTVDQQMTDFSLLDWRVSLALVNPRELGYDSTNLVTDFMMFRYFVPGIPNFTVETFAITRFGSFRKRPDHENIARLQRSVLAAGSDELSLSSSNQNTSTTISDQLLHTLTEMALHDFV